MRLKTFIAACVLVVAPAIASALPVNIMDETDSGSTTALLDFSSHRIEAAYTDGGPGSVGPVALDYTFTVPAADAPQPAFAAAVNLIFQGTVTGLYMNWDTGTGIVTDAFTFTPLAPGVTSASLVLNTVFDAPANLAQTLNIGFADFEGQSIQISVGVAAVPLPAGLLLMGTALGGLGLARRRKRKALAA